MSRHPKLVAALVTEYALQFVAFRLALDRRMLKSARESVEERIADLSAVGSAGSSLYAQLVDKQDQLLTMETLLTPRFELVRRAPQAEQLPTHLVYTSHSDPT
jgi:hypothetical protein